jgi:hypothetical protein
VRGNEPRAKPVGTNRTRPKTMFGSSGPRRGKRMSATRTLRLARYRTLPQRDLPSDEISAEHKQRRAGKRARNPFGHNSYKPVFGQLPDSRPAGRRREGRFWEFAGWLTRCESAVTNNFSGYTDATELSLLFCGPVDHYG